MRVGDWILSASITLVGGLRQLSYFKSVWEGFDVLGTHSLALDERMTLVDFAVQGPFLFEQFFSGF